MLLSVIGRFSACKWGCHSRAEPITGKHALWPIRCNDLCTHPMGVNFWVASSVPLLIPANVFVHWHKFWPKARREARGTVRRDNVKYFLPKTYIPHLDMIILSAGSVSVPRKHKRISSVFSELARSPKSRFVFAIRNAGLDQIWIKPVRSPTTVQRMTVVRFEDYGFQE
jgi:hypothetical protein